MSGDRHGLAAEFAEAETFLAALRHLRELGYTRIEAYLPYPLEGVDEALAHPRTPMATIMLVAGLAGGAGAYFMQWFAAHDYAYNVGGRPLHSWPSFVPVTFELTVLTAAIVGVLALLALARLPRLDHPMFGVRDFGRASQDRFFLCVRADDPRYETALTRAVLDGLGPEAVEEVAS